MSLGLVDVDPNHDYEVDHQHDHVNAASGATGRAGNEPADRALLAANGYEVTALRERPGFIEARVARGPDVVRIEWARDSAFRFFPLVEHAELGLTLHPFDLATNKVLALIGWVEVRVWIDVIECDRHVQPLGYLAWAASGKDPGFGPARILAVSARTTRYSSDEVTALAFDGPPPDAAELSAAWHAILREAEGIIAALPAAEAGKCVCARDGRLFRGGTAEVGRALDAGAIRFHNGSIRGALPRVEA